MELEDKIDKLLNLTEENNELLKSIIQYINYKIVTNSTENINDFSRNVLANLISNRLGFISK